MKHFLDMINSARNTGLTVQRTDGSAPIERRKLTAEEWTYFEKCQPFVFTPKELDDSTITHAIINDKLGEIEDAPFPVFSFEVSGDDMTLASLISAKKNEIQVLCVMGVETTPNQFKLYVYLTEDNAPLTLPTILLANHSLAMPFVNMYLERMRNEQMGLESTRTNVKLGTGANKKMHRIRRVVHVAPKSYIKKDSVGSRQVDWTHRFEVRGHWRKLDLKASGEQPLGKDREGNYDVKGFTWVSHHTRGPEHLPLIKKVRMVET